MKKGGKRRGGNPNEITVMLLSFCKEDYVLQKK